MKKKNMFLAGILALALVFTLGLTSCDGEDPVQFFGLWSDMHPSNPFLLDLKADSVKFDYDPGVNAGLGMLKFELEEAKWEVNATGNNAVIKGKLKDGTKEVGNPAPGTTYSSEAGKAFKPLYDYIKDANAGSEITLEVQLVGDTLVFLNMTFQQIVAY